MNVRLTDQQRDVLETVLSRFMPPVERVDAHGSRVQGTARPGSDIDLVLAGPIDAATLNRVSSALHDSYLSIAADVSAYSLLMPGPFRDHVVATAVPLIDKPLKERGTP